MQTFIVLALSALIPLLVGFIWYNTSFGLGKTWLKESGLTEEDAKNGFKPVKVFGLTYLFGLFIATCLSQWTIHQNGLNSMIADVTLDEETTAALNIVKSKLVDSYRTFKHGALHGGLTGVFFCLPVIGVVSLFENKSMKYIFLHTGYWVVTLALMGGVICQFLPPAF